MYKQYILAEKPSLTLTAHYWSDFGVGIFFLEKYQKHICIRAF